MIVYYPIEKNYFVALHDLVYYVKSYSFKMYHWLFWITLNELVRDISKNDFYLKQL